MPLMFASFFDSEKKTYKTAVRLILFVFKHKIITAENVVPISIGSKSKQSIMGVPAQVFTCLNDDRHIK